MEIILAIIFIGLLLFIFFRPKKEESFSLLLQQINELSRVVDSKLGQSEALIRHQSGETHRIITTITEKLVQLDETNKQVVGITQELQTLQDILKNPKQRGILGEYYLETVLKNVLPTGSYQMQYSFPDGSIVDAVVFVKDKIIPIDSKFSLENYNRLVAEKNPAAREVLETAFRKDLKLRIDETSKYVRPEHGTLEFAFMFIPHEAIYYDLLIAQVGNVKTDAKDLIEYAFNQKRVIIVSPTSFLAFLQTVLQGLRSLEIEEKAKDIKSAVEHLARHLKAYEEYHTKLGKTLETSVNHYNNSNKAFKQIDKDVVKVTGHSIELLLEEVEKPQE